GIPGALVYPAAVGLGTSRTGAGVALDGVEARAGAGPVDDEADVVGDAVVVPVEEAQRAALGARGADGLEAVAVGAGVVDDGRAVVVAGALDERVGAGLLGAPGAEHRAPGLVVHP